MSAMAGLRRGAQALNNQKSGKSSRQSYYARLKPPAMNDQLLKYLTPDETRGTQIAEPVVIINAAYTDVYQTKDENGQPLPGPVIHPAYRYRSHTFPVSGQSKRTGQKYQNFRDISCSAGIDEYAPLPCLGCYQADHGEDVSARDQWAFNVAHLAWYHEVPLVKDGRVVTKRDNKAPIMVKNECQTHRPINMVFSRMDQQNRGQQQARPCEGCQQQAPFIWGDHRLIQVGKNQLNNILGIDAELNKSCVNCGTGIATIGYDCAKCGVEMLNVAQSGWTNAQIETFAKTMLQCRACGFGGPPMPAYECGFDMRSLQKVPGGCADNVDPRPLDIFDVVLWIQREGENTSSTMVVKQWVPISQFKMPNGNLSGTPDNKPLSEALKDIVPKPFDFPEMFKPKSIDEQCKEVQRPNPFVQQQPQYQQYGGQPQQPQQPVPQGYGPPQGGPGFGPPPSAQPPQQQGWGPQAPQQPQQPPQQQGWGPPAPQQGGWGQQPQQPQGGAQVYPPAGRPNYGQ